MVICRWKRFCFTGFRRGNLGLFRPLFQKLQFELFAIKPGWDTTTSITSNQNLLISLCIGIDPGQTHFFDQAVLQGLIGSFHTSFSLWRIGTNQVNIQNAESSLKLSDRFVREIILPIDPKDAKTVAIEGFQQVFTRRIDGTIRPSITPLAVPSISPYNWFFAGELAIRGNNFGRRARLEAVWISMRNDLDVLPIRHHISKYLHGGLMAQYDRPSQIYSLTRRIECTIRSSITPLAVPSISPYNRFFAGELVIRGNNFGRRARLEAMWISIRSDVDVLPIRHYISKYLHGRLMAQYECPSHHSQCPQSRPTTVFLQGSWAFVEAIWA